MFYSQHSDTVPLAELQKKSALKGLNFINQSAEYAKQICIICSIRDFYTVHILPVLHHDVLSLASFASVVHSLLNILHILYVASCQYSKYAKYAKYTPCTIFLDFSTILMHIIFQSFAKWIIATYDMHQYYAEYKQPCKQNITPNINIQNSAMCIFGIFA